MGSCFILSNEDLEHLDVLKDFVEEIAGQQDRVGYGADPIDNNNRAGQSMKHTYRNDLRTSSVSKICEYQLQISWNAKCANVKMRMKPKLRSSERILGGCRAIRLVLNVDMLSKALALKELKKIFCRRKN